MGHRQCKRYTRSCHSRTKAFSASVGEGWEGTSVARAMRWKKWCSDSPLRDPPTSTVSGITLVAPSPAHQPGLARSPVGVLPKASNSYEL